MRTTEHQMKSILKQMQSLQARFVRHLHQQQLKRTRHLVGTYWTFQHPDHPSAITYRMCVALNAKQGTLHVRDIRLFPFVHVKEGEIEFDSTHWTQSTEVCYHDACVAVQDAIAKWSTV